MLNKTEITGADAYTKIKGFYDQDPQNYTKLWNEWIERQLTNTIIDFSGYIFDRDSWIIGKNYKNDDIIDFRSLILPEIILTNADFTLHAYFFKAQFRGDANFIDARFSGDTYFFKAQFRGDANFYKAQFSGDADFRGAQFCGSAYFSKAQFSGYANFREALFSGDAYFIEAQFSDGGANFREVQFRGDANFYKALFSGSANFREALFSGDAAFSGARFSGVADFREAQFSVDAYFSEAQFSGSAHFSEAQFSGDANFTNCIFKNSAIFILASFDKDLNFQYTDFQKSAVFDRLETIYIPDFSFAKFNSTISLYRFDIKKPKRNQNNISPSDNLVDRYRHLKAMAEQAKDQDRKLLFFKGEMRAKRGIETRGFDLILNYLYEFSSNYGSSILLPLAGLMITWLLFAAAHQAILIFIYHSKNWSWSHIWNLLSLSMNYILPTIFPSESRGIIECKIYGFCKNTPALDIPTWLLFMAGIESIIGLVFIFLISLAFRNRFLIK